MAVTDLEILAVELKSLEEKAGLALVDATSILNKKNHNGHNRWSVYTRALAGSEKRLWVESYSQDIDPPIVISPFEVLAIARLYHDLEN